MNQNVLSLNLTKITLKWFFIKNELDPQRSQIKKRLSYISSKNKASFSILDFEIMNNTNRVGCIKIVSNEDSEILKNKSQFLNILWNINLFFL